MRHTVYISLGSNLGDRHKIIEDAIVAIEREIGPVCRRSSLIETEPVGFISEHLFLNQVIEVSTILSPEELLQRTQDIERGLGRIQKSVDGGYQDRTCDLDIILYDDLVLSSDILKIPHPRFRHRRFVLIPLSEIAPEVIDPVSGKTISELLWEES